MNNRLIAPPLYLMGERDYREFVIPQDKLK